MKKCIILFCVLLSVVLCFVGCNEKGESNTDAANDESSGYMHYTGPVFPLTFMDETGGITAARNINYDFSPYENSERTGIVTDSYTLSNETDEDILVTAAYPFAASFYDLDDTLPTITVGGEKINTEINFGSSPSDYIEAVADGYELFNSIESWESYSVLFSETTYFEDAFAEYPKLDEPVIVYEISDAVIDFDTYPNAGISIEFTVESENTSILYWNFSSGQNEDGKYEFGYYPSAYYDIYQCALVIVRGDDISNVSIKDVTYDETSNTNAEIEGASAELTRYESVLDDEINKVIGYKMSWDEVVHSEDTSETATAEMLYRAVLEDYYSGKYWFSIDYSGLASIYSGGRVFYLTFEVTIPAGESVTVTSTSAKEASEIFTGPNTDVLGYDMVTRLGSNINFSEQTASVEDYGLAKIVRQSFGFDLGGQIKEVTLDLNEEHYYLDVRRK